MAVNMILLLRSYLCLLRYQKGESPSRSSDPMVVVEGTRVGGWVELVVVQGNLWRKWKKYLGRIFKGDFESEGLCV